MIPAKSLDSGSLTTTSVAVVGTLLDLEQVMSSHGIQWSIDLVEDGGQVVVSVLGSLDGTEFWTVFSTSAIPGSPPGTYNGGTTFTEPVRYIKASAYATSTSTPVAEVTTWHTARS